MGLEFSEGRIESSIPNSTKCMKWKDVKASHETLDTRAVIKKEDMFCMSILWALGLGGAMLVFIVELITKAHKLKFMKTIGHRTPLNNVPNDRCTDHRNVTWGEARRIHVRGKYTGAPVVVPRKTIIV